MATRATRRRKAAPRKSARSRRPRRKAARARRSAPQRYWSQAVTEHSRALDLEAGVFKLAPKAMARSLLRSAQRSTRRKSSPFRSAMSMLTFYQNRAGHTLSATRRRALQRATEELRRLARREPSARARAARIRSAPAAKESSRP
jgi:hypothetical protein